MSDLAEPDYGGATYRTKDAITNLKIRVLFGKVTSSLGDDNKSATEKEEYIFSWQEKVFSLTEREHYAVKENCTTPLKEKYHKDIQRIKETGGFKNTRLFTYVDHDEHVRKVERLTTAEEEIVSFAGEQILTLRQRPNASVTAKRETDSQAPRQRINVVLDDPTPEQKEERHLLPPSLQTFHIMADLSPLPGEQQEEVAEGAVVPDEVNTARDEVTLCTIRLAANGVVTVTPDFNVGRKEYRVESTRGRESYEYLLENVSKPISRLEHENEHKMMKEIYSRHAELYSAIIGSDFEASPEDSLRLFVNGEIVSAHDFEYDNLYVHYFLDLPKDWTALTLDQLSGTTQVSKAKILKRNSVHYFCFPFEFQLLYQKNLVSKINEDNLPGWPNIYFEVLSLDSWTRYRTEGYGCLTIPATPGCHSVKINCWRPIGNSIVCELRRFFVGGTPELEDTTFSAIPSTFEGKYLGKYGFRTESTGNLKFRLNCVQQSKSFLEENLEKKSARSLINRIGGSLTHTSVMGVIRAFEKARANLIHVRQAFEWTIHRNEEE